MLQLPWWNARVVSGPPPPDALRRIGVSRRAGAGSASGPRAEPLQGSESLQEAIEVGREGAREERERLAHVDADQVVLPDLRPSARVGEGDVHQSARTVLRQPDADAGQQGVPRIAVGHVR